MDDSAFSRQAAETLHALGERIEAQLADHVEIELEGGILTLELADGRKFVLNRHQPSRQMWLASPISGATHFAWRDGAWRSTRSEAELASLLAADLETATGRRVALT